MDLTSRIGGDEFALLLRNCSTDDACRIVDSLCRAISALRFQWEGREFRVSASFGLAEIDASVDSSAAALLLRLVAIGDRGGDKAADVLAGVQAVNRFVEDRVREHPVDWFWVHKRWPAKVYAALSADDVRPLCDTVAR